MRADFFRVAVPALILLSSCTPVDGSTGPSRTPATIATGHHSADALPDVTLGCGAQVTADLRLTNDLACNGNGFTVSGDDITIDLNGRTLSGNGTGNGIAVNASHRVRVFGGSIRGFQSGIFVSGSTEVVIHDNEFSATNQAVLLQATTASTIKHNTVTRNLARGFMLRPNLTGGLSTDNVVIGNVVIDTPTGIYLIRQPGNTIEGNTVVGALVAGIDVAEGAGQVSGTIVRANLLTGGGSGIRISAGWVDNTVVGNRISANACAISGPVSGNTFHGNVLVGNAADVCP
jgi:parallel beta-helix repeat protein